MADDKKKTKLPEKIGLFIDKVLTFGGGLQFDQSDIDNAVKAIDAETEYEVNTYKDIKTQEDFDKFKKILNQMSKQDIPPQGKDGGAVKKMKNGGTIGKTMPKTRSKPRVAGRLAMRGYGKAFKK
jgi:hypothetical protein